MFNIRKSLIPPHVTILKEQDRLLAHWCYTESGFGTEQHMWELAHQHGRNTIILDWGREGPQHNKILMSWKMGGTHSPTKQPELWSMTETRLLHVSNHTLQMCHCPDSPLCSFTHTATLSLESEFWVICSWEGNFSINDPINDFLRWKLTTDHAMVNFFLYHY